MILTCPSCATRYLVDPAVLPPGGRTVRCANCNHNWHENPPPDALRKVEFDPPPVLKPIPRGSNLPALTEPRKPRKGVAFILIMLFLAALAGGGWYGRARLVELWPPIGHIYDLLHIPIERPARLGLVLRNLNSSTALENGQSILTVTGEVANVIDEPRPTPKLRVSLRNAERREIRNWEITLSEVQIKAGDKVVFSSRHVNPPPDARDLEITFITDSGKSE